MRISAAGGLSVGTTVDAGAGNLLVAGVITSSKAGKNSFTGIDTTSYAAGVGGSIDLGGNYRAAGDAGAFTRIAAEKTNGVDNDFGYDLGFYVTTNLQSTIGTKVATMTSTGNVSIGTSSPTPSARLQVRTGTNLNFAVQTGTTDTSGIKINAFNDAANANIPLEINGSVLLLKTGETERARIDSSGNVGIGTDSPSDKLTIKAASSHLRLQGTSNTNKNVSINYNESGDYGQINCDESGVNQKDLWMTGLNLKFGRSTGSESMRIDDLGNLLVGRSSAGAAATDNGHVFYGTGQHYIFSNATECVRFYETSGSGQQVGSISITSSATAFNTSSDQRLKENIVDAPSASDDIDAIQVRQFDWKADGSHQKYGMVAQELQSVAPIAVTGDADSDEMMGVDYSKLVPMMLKEIQSLRARVAQLEGAN
jgi:hypothetical protein